jgi:hypothetical protein
MPSVPTGAADTEARPGTPMRPASRHIGQILHSPDCKLRRVNSLLHVCGILGVLLTVSAVLSRRSEHAPRAPRHQRVGQNLRWQPIAADRRRDARGR